MKFINQDRQNRGRRDVTVHIPARRGSQTPD